VTTGAHKPSRATHLVAVEVSVVRSADACIETKRKKFHDFDSMRHDGYFMQAGLAIEENNVSVFHVTLHCIAYSKIFCNGIAIPKR
jgi:hypothetical protein